MSRVFDASTSNFLRRIGIGGTFNNADGLSIAAYVNPDVTNISQFAASVAQYTFANEPRAGVGIFTDAKARGFADIGNGSQTACNAYSTGTVSASSWQLLVMTFDETSDTCTVYNNSATGATDTQTTTENYSDITSINVGVLGDSTPSGAFDGKVAMVTTWDTELTSANVTSLLNATTMGDWLAVQTDNIRNFVPLLDDQLYDFAKDNNSENLTVNGTVNSSTDDPSVATGDCVKPIGDVETFTGGSGTYTAKAGSNRIVLAFVVAEGGSPPAAPSSFTLGSQDFTQEIYYVDNEGANSGIHQGIYYIKEADIPSGAQTVSWSWASTPGSANTVVLVTLANVDQTTPFTGSNTAQANSGTSATSSSLTLADNDMAIGMCLVSVSTYNISNPSGYIPFYVKDDATETNSHDANAVFKMATGSGSETPAFTFSDNGYVANFAVIKHASGTSVAPLVGRHLQNLMAGQ